MSDLTRRKDPDRATAGISISGDVHFGTIARSVGNPNAKPQWQWLCGFYPSSWPGEQRGGTVPDFAKAHGVRSRLAHLFSHRTEADYQTWRDQRDWTTRKYAMRDRGERVPLR